MIKKFDNRESMMTRLVMVMLTRKLTIAATTTHQCSAAAKKSTAPANQYTKNSKKISKLRSC